MDSLEALPKRYLVATHESGSQHRAKEVALNL